MSPSTFDSGLRAAVSGSISRFQALDIVANNLANANSTAFKRDIASFDQLLNKATGAAEIRIRETVTDQRQGTVKTTGNPFDVAIEGDGFFQVETPQGPMYTRQGNFTRNSEGLLVTTEGNPVLAEGSPITIDGRDIEIASDGTVSSDGKNAGQLTLYSFVDGSVLEKQGQGMFSPKDGATPARVAVPTVIQGALEMSNVNVMQEMIRMVEFQREFETFQKMIKTYNTLATKADEIGNF